MKKKKVILTLFLTATLSTASVAGALLPVSISTAASSTQSSTTSSTSSDSSSASSSTDSSSSSSKPSGQPPAKPSDSSSSGSSSSKPSGQPPAKPSGSSSSNDSSSSSSASSDGSSGQVPSGQAPSGDSSAQAPSGQAPSGGSSGSTAVTSWTAVKEFSSKKSTTGKTYASTGTDENAIHVSGGSVILNRPVITRISSSSTGGDNASFYGVGAALLTTAGKTYVNGGTITTNAAGGAGIFSYDKGVTYAQGVKITTAKDASGGVHVAGGGKLYAWGLDVTTSGASSAAIRSDRGGGTMVIDGGNYTTNGTGSPAIYSTADISVNNATLTANNSEGICIEGENTVRLFDSDLTSNMPDNTQNDNTWSVILYQSQSGDSKEGTSTFDMVGGSLTSKNGGLFYTTNTSSTFLLKDVTIKSSNDCEYFLKCTGNSNARGWGESGKNGADCSFTAVSQKMSGNILYDSISNLDFYMTDGSTLKGAFIDDESNAGSGGSGACNVYISSDSVWTVTKNSTVTNLYNEGTIKDAKGNTVTIKGTDGTVYVKGTSSYTITVSSYSTKADFSKASSVPSWSSYQVSKPDCLTATLLGTKTASTVSTGSGLTSALPFKKKIYLVAIAGTALLIAAVMFVLRYRKRHKKHSNDNDHTDDGSLE